MSNMATSIAINANVQSSIAASRAAEANRIACQGYENNFNPTTATVSQKQQYASCIERLYPNELSMGSVVVLKLGFVICLLAMGFGIWKGDDLVDKVLGAIMCFVGTAGALTIGTLLIMGMMWVFS